MVTGAQILVGVGLSLIVLVPLWLLTVWIDVRQAEKRKKDRAEARRRRDW